MSDPTYTGRAPSSYALALVILLIVAGVLLRWWGPINPSIRVAMVSDHSSISGYGSAEVPTGWKVDGTAQVTLNLANGSHSPVTVKRVRAVSLPNPDGLRLPQVTVRQQPTHLPPGRSADLDVTVVAAPACRAWSARQPDEGAPPPPGLDQGLPSGQFSLVVDLRTSSGRVKSVGRNIRFVDVCPTQAYLPSAGAQPADPTAARRAVTAAFWTAYDTRNSLDDRAASIDDVTGLPGGIPTGVRSQVHQIVFTSPSAASVVYDIYLNGDELVSDRIGHARLVDGTWKVTRGTVCRDVVLAKQRCD